MAKLIGTAGHVDHGKTTLIQALTGIDADRLPEEKQRGMTIDIGFAFIDFPEIGRVSIVDVPGHERFISNMLVGALGIDVALLCVAADEGVKPQTEEHLEILDLLPVEKMVVALTRADLVDSETRELAGLEVAELLEGTKFEGSPMVAVSAITGEGLRELSDTLQTALTSHPGRSPRSGEADPGASLTPWYLPIDRAFAVKGHGVVVTGTLAQGQVKVGEKAYIEPGHLEVRVRSIHSHGEESESSERGKRTALNLSGIKLQEIHRGQAVGAEGALFETTMFDAKVRWLREIKHGMRVRVSLGAEEVIGKLFLSETTPEVVQFRLECPVAAALDQPFVVRLYSPPDVLGGGRVLVPVATKRRRSEKAVLASATDPGEAILDLLRAKPQGLGTEEICRVLGKTPQQLGDVFERLSKEGKAKGFAGLWVETAAFAVLQERLLSTLGEFHENNPAIAAAPREQVVHSAGLSWSGKPLDRILSTFANEGRISVQGTGIRLPQFRVKLSDKQEAFLSRAAAALDRASPNVPSPEELAKLIPAPVQAVQEILRLGIQSGEIVRIADDIYYSSQWVSTTKERIRDSFKDRPFSAGEFRDLMGTSRKYAIALLEYLDSVRFTLRVGDNRVVRKESLTGD